MIEKKLESIDFYNSWTLWCDSDKESADLAYAVQIVSEYNLPVISVAQSAVPIIWPWLENTKTKIMARFNLMNKKINESVVSDCVEKINAVFKQGADGAQVFLKYSELGGFVDFLHVIRDDLFFDKELSIGVELKEMGAFDWTNLYDELRRLNVNSVLFVFSQDLGNKSDFVGRIYALLNAWNKDNNFDLCFSVGHSSLRIEQIVRLVEQIQPCLVERLNFIVDF